MEATLAHVVHVGGDVPSLNQWYQGAFDVTGFMGWPDPHYLESERRHASMFMVGDLAVETMAPARPVDESTAVGRAFARRGEHLFSMAFRVPDLVVLGERLLDRGVFIGGPGGGRADHIGPDVRYFVPSPRDTGGLRFEFLDVVLAGDPRTDPQWTATMRLDRLLVEVIDPAAAAATLIDVLGAAGHEGGVQVGDIKLELRRGDPPRLLGAAFGSGESCVIGHGATFLV